MPSIELTTHQAVILKAVLSAMVDSAGGLYEFTNADGESAESALYALVISYFVFLDSHSV